MNLLSIDVEDYYMVSAFEGVVGREDWELYESRVERNTYAVLDLLDSVPSPAEAKGDAPRKATFFCLGWVAKRYPGLIKEISQRGHEVASHGWDHRRITTMSPGEFRQDVQRSRMYLEDLIGRRVMGYRAPSYSITRDTLWALRILAEEGYQYDSSIFPIRHDLYGFPGAPRVPFLIEMNGAGYYRIKLMTFSTDRFRGAVTGGWKCSLSSGAEEADLRGRGFGLKPPKGKVELDNEKIRHDAGIHRILEFPPATLRFFRRNLPVAGGGYFRLFPLSFTRWAMKSINKEGLPVTFYLHPWELDPEQPRVEGLGIRSKFRHYLNLGRTAPRFQAILEAFHCMPFSSFLKDAKLDGVKLEFRRRWARVPTDLKAYISVGDRGTAQRTLLGRAKVRDLSLGGLF